MKNHRVIGIDLSGFGQSDKPCAINYGLWAHDIESVLTELNVEDAALGGFSMGGAIAAHFVAAYNQEMSISLPTLICHGAQDKVVPFAAGEAQHQLIKKLKTGAF